MHSSRMHTAHRGSASVLAGIHTPWAWAWRPHLGVGLETPPGCGYGDPPGQTPRLSPWVWASRPPPGQIPQLPPWVWAWEAARHAGIPLPRDLLHLQCMLGYHPPTPPVDRMTDTCKNITFANFICGW